MTQSSTAIIVEVEPVQMKQALRLVFQPIRELGTKQSVNLVKVVVQKKMFSPMKHLLKSVE